jgi:hypothetical protein
MTVADEIKSRVESDAVTVFAAVLGASSFKKKGAEFYTACPFTTTRRRRFT